MGVKFESVQASKRQSVDLKVCSCVQQKKHILKFRIVGPKGLTSDCVVGAN